MIYGVLTKFNQNLNKNQDLNGHKLLTFNLLAVNKDQLCTVKKKESPVFAGLSYYYEDPVNYFVL